MPERLIPRRSIVGPRAFGAMLAVGLGLAAPSARADLCESKLDPLPSHGKTPLPSDRLGCNLLDAGTGENLLFYGAAVLSTMELSASGADHEIRVAFEENLGTRGFSDVTVALGYYALPAIGALVYGTGLVAHDRKLAAAGAAALQAMTVTFATTVLFKGLTGRPFPNHGGDPTSPERLEHPEWAREWRGPLLENSAWPSGHTSVAVALAASLSGFYADIPWLPWVLYPSASVIAFGMMSGAHHWASDVIAGALLGHAVGTSIGHDFRRMQDTRASKSRVALVPFGTRGSRSCRPFECSPGARRQPRGNHHSAPVAVAAAARSSGARLTFVPGATYGHDEHDGRTTESGPGDAGGLRDRDGSRLCRIEARGWCRPSRPSHHRRRAAHVVDGR